MLLAGQTVTVGQRFPLLITWIPPLPAPEIAHAAVATARHLNEAAGGPVAPSRRVNGVDAEEAGDVEREFPPTPKRGEILVYERFSDLLQVDKTRLYFIVL